MANAPLRLQRLAAALAVAFAVTLDGTVAFTSPSHHAAFLQVRHGHGSSPVGSSSVSVAASRRFGTRGRSNLAASSNRDNDNGSGSGSGKADDEIQQPSNPIAEIARPIAASAASSLLAASLLFSPADNIANAVTPARPPSSSSSSSSSATATSIDIKLSSVPALTRKIISNRDTLTTYVVDSFKSFKPILQLLSESDTVTVRPPADVKGAVNAALTKGDARFVVNGEDVDVRVESVPGVIIVRVINPNIPRIPFLRDGTAALKFVDEIVDVAPAEFEKAAEEVEAIEKFLMWGAPRTAPIRYEGSSLDYFLSSKFLWNGRPATLGSLGEVTNSEVVALGVTTGLIAAYGASYAYYIALQEEAERETEEKKAETEKKRLAKVKADAAKKAAEAAKEGPEAASADADTDAEEAQRAEAKKKKDEESKRALEEAKKRAAEMAAAKQGPSPPAAAAPASEEEKPKGRKRDVFKKMFRRGEK